MSNVSQDKLDRSNGDVLQGLPGALLVSLKVVGDRLRLHEVFRWFQVEWLRYATIRNLDRLNDDYLDDIGIKRKDIRPIVEAMVKCMRQGRLGSQPYLTVTLASMATAGVVPGWPSLPAKENVISV